jgi:glycoside/pentoside/hexuronide:cation symporter, GPH family
MNRPLKAGQRLSAAVLASYGAPAAVFGILLLPPYVFLPAFYTQTLGLPLAAIGFIIFASRLFDAVTDPVIGLLSDRTGGRLGRRKPWIVAGAPIAMMAVVLLFAPPVEPTLTQFAIGIFALTLGWTMLMLPYAAWGAELSGDYNERTRITGVREGVGLFGTLIAVSLPTLLTAAGYADPRVHMAGLAIIVIVLMVPTVSWLIFYVPEPAPLSRARVSTRDGIISLRQNEPFRRLIVAYLINAFANGLPATLFVLYVSHVIGAPDSYGPLLLAYFLSGLIAIPFWSWLAGRIGKHRAWAYSMIFACAVFAFTPFVVGQGDIIPFLVISILSGVSVGADLVIPASIQADVVDVDTQASGEQRTGLFFALWGIATKLAFALAALSLPILSAAGFAADALSSEGKTQNTPEALLALTFLYAIVPVGLKLIAIALMWNFPLDAARQAAVRAKIEQARVAP